MTYNIDVVSHIYPVDANKLAAAAATVMGAHECKDSAGVSVRVTGNEEIQALNRQYRSVDRPTDVLSFPAERPPLPPDALAEAETHYLGDVVIAYPYTSTQAAQLGHAPDDHLVLMVVHGVLHLLGYDHDTPQRRATMWEAQAHSLQALGVPLAVVPALETFNE